MKIVVLGSGTSNGIPIIGCTCDVCSLKEPKNSRYRSSILITDNDTSIVIDTTPEFRLQAIRADLQSLNAVLYTHSHADHIHGLDDLRAFSYKIPIDVWGSKETLDVIKKRFEYIFIKTQKGGGKPQLNLKRFDENGFITIGKIKIELLPVKHGQLDVHGFRIGDFAYITDCSHIPEKTMKKLIGVNTFIIGALRYRVHETHFNLEQAIDVIKKIDPDRAYLTHICHDMDHTKLLKELPPGIEPCYDGLELFV